MLDRKKAALDRGLEALDRTACRLFIFGQYVRNNGGGESFRHEENWSIRLLGENSRQVRIERPGNRNRIVANDVPRFVALQVEDDIFDHEPAPVSGMIYDVMLAQRPACAQGEPFL